MSKRVPEPTGHMRTLGTTQVQEQTGPGTDRAHEGGSQDCVASSAIPTSHREILSARGGVDSRSVIRAPRVFRLAVVKTDADSENEDRSSSKSGAMATPGRKSAKSRLTDGATFGSNQGPESGCPWASSLEFALPGAGGWKVGAVPRRDAAELLHGISGPFGGSGSCRRLPSPQQDKKTQLARASIPYESLTHGYK